MSKTTGHNLNINSIQEGNGVNSVEENREKDSSKLLEDDSTMPPIPEYVRKVYQEEVPIKESIPVSIKQNSKRRKSLAAFVILLLILASVVFANKKQILAEGYKKLYFIPQVGTTDEIKNPEVYLLPKPISFDNKEGKPIVIKQIVKKNNLLTIHLEGYVDKYVKLKLEDRTGKVFSDNTYTIIGSGNGDGEGNYTFSNLPKDMTDFSILSSTGANVAISLKKAIGQDEFKDIDATDTQHDVSITLVPTKMNTRMKFNLVQNHTEGKKICYYGKFNPNSKEYEFGSIRGENGKDYTAKRGKYFNEFYFTPDTASKKYFAELPEVALEYNIKKEVSFPVPKKGKLDINKTVQVNTLSFTITQVSIEGTKFRIYIKYNNTETETIQKATFTKENWNGGYLLHENKDGIVDYYEMEKPSEKEIKLEFNSIYTVLKGPWKFTINP